jgi:hypothetical protein
VWVALYTGPAAGACLTAAVTVMLTLSNRRHEHKKWLTEKRLDVYSEYNHATVAWLDQYNIFKAEYERGSTERMESDFQKVFRLDAQIQLLAPPDVSEKTRSVTRRIALSADMRPEQDTDNRYERRAERERVTAADSIYDPWQELLGMQREDQRGEWERIRGGARGASSRLRLALRRSDD